MESLDLELAHKTIKRYVCSACWGELELGFNDLTDPSRAFVVCKRCQDETRGYVTKYFVDRRRGESLGELRDVKNLLYATGIWQKPVMSREQIMKELGY